MSSTLRTALGRVLLAASTIALIACSDALAGPTSNGTVRGARSLKDSTGINWDDTTNCRNGYGVTEGRIVCGPE
jgi:hypothetical protein